MKISVVAAPPPPPPPKAIEMTFLVDDAWAIIAALREYVISHPNAVERDTWKRWANELDDKARA